MKSKYLIDWIGSTPMSGESPVVMELLEALLDDAGPLATHRAHRGAWYADLLSTLLVPAAAIDDVVAGLEPSDHARPVLLTAGDDPAVPAEVSRQHVRAARDLLAEDDRVEVVGVRLAVPIGPRVEATSHLLHALDFSVPAWIEVSPLSGWQDVLRVIAADGAENLTLLLDGASAEAAAGVLHTAVDEGLSFRLGGSALPAVTGAEGAGYGWLNVLCAVRAALDGAGPAALAQILLTTQAAPITAELRRMGIAQAAAARELLVAVEIADVAEAAGELERLGLLTRD